MDGSSLPGQVRKVENIKWSISVSPFYVNNKRVVIIPLSEHISVCYMKPLEWAVGVVHIISYQFPLIGNNVHIG